MQRHFALGLAVIAALSASVPALAGSGTAVGVKRDASLQTPTVVQVLTVGDDIGIGDRVITDASGLVQIKFTDDTELVVGPRSSLVIDDYLIRSDGSPGRFAINALQGTFRFVSGNARKDRYEITTPTGTLSIRGTAFDFFVEDEMSSVLAYTGEVTMCTHGGRNCETLSSSCEVGQFDMAEPRVLGRGRADKKVNDRFFSKAFPYSMSQSRLLPDFRIREARNCASSGPSAFPDVASTSSDTPAGVAAVVPSAPEPPPPQDPPSGGGGDSCAGNSGPNPGNSQNCNR